MTNDEIIKEQKRFAEERERGIMDRYLDLAGRFKSLIKTYGPSAISETYILRDLWELIEDEIEGYRDFTKPTESRSLKTQVTEKWVELIKLVERHQKNWKRENKKPN